MALMLALVAGGGLLLAIVVLAIVLASR